MLASKEIYKANDWWKKVNLSLGTFKRLIHTDLTQSMTESAIRTAIDELKFIQSDIASMRSPLEAQEMHGRLIEAINCLQQALEEKLQHRDLQYAELLLEARSKTRQLQSKLLYIGIMETFLPNSKSVSKPSYFAHMMTSKQDEEAHPASIQSALKSFTMQMGVRMVILGFFIITCIMVCQTIIPTGDLF